VAWRTLTEDDLSARLSDGEISAYRADAAWNVNPPEKLLADAADFARGFILANRAAVMCKTEHSVPSMLVGPCVDIAVFDLLKRIGVGISEERTSAWRNANTLLEKIAEGKITPEPGAESPAASANLAGSISVPEQKL